MKKVIYLLIVHLFCCSKAFTQQKPQYTQYILNNYVINPAISGIENYIDVKVAYRNQWSGLENAPKTSYLTVHAPLGKNDDRITPTTLGADRDNTMGRNYAESYTAADPHHGIGLSFLDDKTGAIEQTSLNLTYAYHLGLSAKVNMAVGIGVGANKTSLNATDLQFENAGDPAISGGLISKTNPDVNAGIWIYSSSYFLGASVQQILQKTVSFSDNTSPVKSKTIPHTFITAGFRFWANDDITIVPSIMIKSVQPTPLGIDLNTKIAFRDKVWIGASYRKNDSFSGMLGFSFGSLVNISYSYDVTTSALGGVSNGTHEIVWGMLLNNRGGVNCPRKFW